MIKEGDIINGYRFEKLIYKNIDSTYIVYKNGEPYVIKEYIRNENEFTSFIQEYYHLTILNHPNIIKPIELFIHDENYYIVFKYYSYTLSSKLIIELTKTDKLYITDKLKRKWIYQLVDIFLYLHSKNIVYADLKLNNIMLDDYDNIILIDFGLSFNSNIETKSLYDSDKPFYPKDKIVNKHSDIWMLGHTISYIDPDNSIIKYMKNDDPKLRPTIEQVIKYEYFTSPQDKDFKPTLYNSKEENNINFCLNIFI